MTTVIDERVVEMRFNNADFEKNVAQSMSTLDKLKKSLNFDTGKSLENIGKATKGFSLSGMTETITEATTKFSALEIAGITAIANITNKAVDFGAKFVKSLSIDQVASGFQKYADKTTAVQTIIASTGMAIEDIEAQMERLNWFTDETSYNFVDMVSNIGKFTSAGISLEKAQGAMQGIANWAARSGQNAQAASRAMYNFAQAMGAGAMKLQDWKSIENANMATIEFKQTALETAAEMGKLRKVADGLYTTLDGKAEVTATNFSESLKKKWFDADVMVATLNRYNSYADELYELSEKTGRTASQLMMDADEYAAGTLKIGEISKSTGVSVEELAEAYESLNSESNKLSRQAFKNAQEAKTFQEVIDATADAVSTSWMNTFQTIFGNYEEAKALWSGMANFLVEAFTAAGTFRNEVLSFWRDSDQELDGRANLIRGIVNLLNLVIKPINAIKAAFASMFPDAEQMGNILKQMTLRFKEFTERLQPSEEVLKDIYFIFKGLFTIGKLVGDILFGVVKAILPIARPFGSLLEMILHFLGYIGQIVVALDRFIDKTSAMQVIIALLSTLFSNFLNIVKNVAMIIGGTLVGGITLFVNLISKAVTAVSNFVSKSGFLSKIINSIGNAIRKVKSFFTGFNKETETAVTTVVKLKENLAGANDVIVKTGTVTRDSAQGFKQAMTPMQAFLNVLKTIGAVVGGAVTIALGAIRSLGSGLATFFTSFVSRFKAADATSKNFFDHIKALFTAFVGALGDAGERIKAVFEAMAGDKFKGVAEIIHKITEKIKELTSSLDVGKIAAIAFAGTMVMLVASLAKIVQTVTETVSSVKGVFDTINKVIKGKFAKKSSTIMDLAKAFAIIAGSLALLVAVNKNGGLDDVTNSMFKLIITFTACAAVLKGLDFLFAKFSKGIKAPLVSTSILALAGSIAILTGALYILNEINIKEGIRDKLKIIGIMLLELVAAAWLLSKLAPKLAKGSVLLLALAGSMYIMIKAFKEITSEDLTNVQENMVGFGLFFGAMSLMIAAAGKIKITSALSLLLVAKAIQMIMPELKSAIKTIDDNGTFSKILDATTKFFNKLKEWFKNLVDTIGVIGTTIGALAAIGTLVGSISLLIALFKAIGEMGNLLKGVGIAAAGIGVGIVLIANAMKKFAEIKKDMSAEDFKAIGDVIKGFIAAMGIALGAIQLMGVLSNLAGKKLLKWTDNIAVNFAAVAAAFVSIGASMVLIAVALRIAAKINPDDIVKVGLIMGALMVAMSIPIFAAGTVKSGVSAMMSMMSAVAALAVLIAEMSILTIVVKNTDEALIWAAIGIIAAFMGGLAIVAGVAGNVKSALPIFATLALIVGAVASIGTALYMLKGISWDEIWPALAGMGLTFTALIGAVVGLSFLSKVLTPQKTVLLGGVLLLCMLALLEIGYILQGLSKISWESIKGPLEAMGLVFAALMGAVVGLAFLSKILTKQKTLLVGGLLIMCMAALLEVGVILAGMSRIPWASLKGPLLAMGLVFAALMGAVVGLAFLSKILTKQKTLLVGGLLIMCMAALLEVGVVLAGLSSIPWDSFKGPLGAIAGVMGVMTVMMAAVAIVSGIFLKDAKSIGGAIALMIGTILSLAAAAAALYVLSDIDTGALLKAAGVMAILMGVMSVFAGLMAVLTFVIGSVAGALGAGAAGFYALPVLIAAIAVAMVAAAGSFAIAAASVSIFADGLGKLYDPLSQLATLDLITISSDLMSLAVACGALGIGLGVFGVGGIVGAAAFALLGAALMLFNASAQAAVPSIQALAEIDLKSLAENFKHMAVGGLEMIVGAAGLYLYAKALDTLIKSLKEFSTVKNVMGNFFKDTKSALSSGATETSGTAKNAAITIAKAFVLGWRTTLGWFSPPKIVTGFLADMGYALSDTGQLTRIADGSAVSIGEAFAGGFEGSLSGLGDWFQGFLGNMLGMASNFSYKIRGLLNFSGGEISQFGANGMPTNVINKMYGGSSTISSLADMFKEVGKDVPFLNGGLESTDFLLGDITGKVEEMTGGVGDLSGAMDEAAGKSGKAGKALKDFRDSLKDTISGQLDMFSKFEIKTEMTSNTILENMRSNIDGFASWSHRMTVLSERFIEHGISDTLYKKLAEMGPKGYETMNAIYQMTDEQLDELKTLWETGLTLPEGQADIVASGYQYMGEMATQGFSDALNDHKAAHEAAHGLGKAALDGLREALDVHSPSQETFKIGVFLIDGLGLGMTSSSALAMLELCVSQVSEKILTLFTEKLSPETLGETGNGILDALFANVLGGASETNPIVTAFTNGLMNLEPVYEALLLFVEAITSKLNEAFRMEDSNSPSVLFYEYGKSSIQGYANGISNNISFVKFAISILVTSALGTLNAKNLPSKFYDIGKNVTLGFANGLADTEAAKKVQRNAEEIAQKAIETMKNATKESSPSKLTRQIGFFVSEGLAIGIADGARNVEKAAQTVAEDGIDAINDMGRLQDVLNNELDLNPVITPMLDLSVLRSQIGELNALMAGNTTMLNGQNGGQFTAKPEPTSINFTQNNYSPKELSRYDIYRNTKNQISMMKGVMRANA